MANMGSCGKHPNLQQLPGVCSSCLRERLHQLVASPETATPTTAAYPRLRVQLKSTSFSSTSSILQGPRSPGGGSRRRTGQGRHKRNGSFAAAEVAGSVLLGVKCGAGGGLKKSRSMASVTGGNEEEVEGERVKMMKKGFWSKLIRFRSMRRNHHHRHHQSTGREIFMH